MKGRSSSNAENNEEERERKEFLTLFFVGRGGRGYCAGTCVCEGSEHVSVDQLWLKRIGREKSPLHAACYGLSKQWGGGWGKGD